MLSVFLIQSSTSIAVLIQLLKHCCAKLDDYIHALETVTSEMIGALLGAG